MVSLVKCHTNATRIGWHMSEIGLRFAPGLPPGRFFLFDTLKQSLQVLDERRCTSEAVLIHLIQVCEGVCVCMFVCVCVLVCVRAREKKRKREKHTEREKKNYKQRERGRNRERGEGGEAVLIHLIQVS